jgi:hypothetical protein
VSLIDYATIIGRAAWVRHQAGYLADAPPPYSSRHILERVFPRIAVAGAELPRGVTEMAVAEKGGRALFYSRKVSHPHQRVGLIHGLYHHLSDIKDSIGLRECNLTVRKLAAQTGSEFKDPLELSCDLFAAEVLVPLDVLDQHAPTQLYGTKGIEKEALEDEIDHLSSRFNVPKKFMKWRLWDLGCLRRSNFFLSK